MVRIPSGNFRESGMKRTSRQREQWERRNVLGGDTGWFTSKREPSTVAFSPSLASEALWVPLGQR